MNPKDTIILLCKEALRLHDDPGKNRIEAYADSIASLLYAAVLLHKLIMLTVPEDVAKAEFLKALEDCYNDVKLNQQLLKAKVAGALN